jgi:hypothetical protein
MESRIKASERLMTVKELAAMLHIEPQTVHFWRTKGTAPWARGSTAARSSSASRMWTAGSPSALRRAAEMSRQRSVPRLGMPGDRPKADRGSYTIDHHQDPSVTPGRDGSPALLRRPS